ncbi:hypothetical protein ACOME3_009575 [Neoechinorhynchus agilis]
MLWVIIGILAIAINDARCISVNATTIEMVVLSSNETKSSQEEVENVIANETTQESVVETTNNPKLIIYRSHLRKREVPLYKTPDVIASIVVLSTSLVLVLFYYVCLRG